jgi:hypothetical protein
VNAAHCLSAKQGAFVGALKQFANGKATVENMRECIKLMEKKSRVPQVSNMITTARKWANDIGVFF